MPGHVYWERRMVQSDSWDTVRFCGNIVKGVRCELKIDSFVDKSSVVLNKKKYLFWKWRSEIYSHAFPSLHREITLFYFFFGIEDPATKGYIYITRNLSIWGKWVKEAIAIPRNWWMEKSDNRLAILNLWYVLPSLLYRVICWFKKEKGYNYHCT